MLVTDSALISCAKLPCNHGFLMQKMFNCNIRPHPNECSGSDLGGDIYFVCWDPELLPPRQIEPMDYNPAQSQQVDHDVTIEV
jgi:RNA-dependent RNA polymerase